MKEFRLARPNRAALEEAIKNWGMPRKSSIKCNCDRIGCNYDHSEHFARRAALERLIDREMRRD